MNIRERGYEQRANREEEPQVAGAVRQQVAQPVRKLAIQVHEALAGDSNDEDSVDNDRKGHRE